MKVNPTTEAQRRLALQLAIQLPENIAEARQVLALAGELLDGFLAEPSPARRRAIKLGWGTRAPPVQMLESARRRPEMRTAVLWGLASLLVTLPLAALASDFVGAGIGVTFMTGVTVVALLFGTLPALALGAASALLHNLLLVPPAYEFSWPCTLEIVLGAGYLVLAIGLPLVAKWRARIRAIAIGGGEVEVADNVVELAGVRAANQA